MENNRNYIEVTYAINKEEYDYRHHRLRGLLWQMADALRGEKTSLYPATLKDQFAESARLEELIKEHEGDWFLMDKSRGYILEITLRDFKMKEEEGGSRNLRPPLVSKLRPQFVTLERR